MACAGEDGEDNATPTGVTDGGPLDTGADGTGRSDAEVDVADEPEAGTSDRTCVGPVEDPTRSSVCTQESFTFDGRKRAYILCVPDPIPPGPLPLVLAFHGGGGNAGAWYQATEWRNLVGPSGYVVVYPQGCQEEKTDCTAQAGSFSWNIGKLDDPREVDDQGFVIEVVARLVSVHGLTIDDGCRFGTGHSLGGMFLYSLTCDHPELFTAIGPISAPPTDATCEPFGDTSVYHVHGTKDDVVPFDTGCCSQIQKTQGDPAYLPGCDGLPVCQQPSTWWPPVRSGEHPFTAVTGLDDMATAGLGCKNEWAVSEESGATTCHAYQDCRQGLAAEVCLIEGVGHNLKDISAAFAFADFHHARFRGARAR
jgi:poly(3-hydroxybutyrate) depolymerase